MGKSASATGRNVTIYGQRYEKNAEKGLNFVPRKLKDRLGPPVTKYAFATKDPDIEAIMAYRTRTAATYTGTRLGDLDSKARGDILEKVCRYLDMNR